MLKTLQTFFFTSFSSISKWSEWNLNFPDMASLMPLDTRDWDLCLNERLWETRDIFNTQQNNNEWRFSHLKQRKCTVRHSHNSLCWSFSLSQSHLHQKPPQKLTGFNIVLVFQVSSSSCTAKKKTYCSLISHWLIRCLDSGGWLE